MFETNKFTRDDRTQALVSKDIEGLRRRQKELDNERRIEKLEETVEAIDDKINTIISLLQGRDF